MNLSAVPIGAFYDDQLSEGLSLPADEAPLYVIPVGHQEGGYGYRENILTMFRAGAHYGRAFYEDRSD